MRILPLALLLLCTVPVFAQSAYHRADLEDTVGVKDDGDDKYTLTRYNIDYKALNYYINEATLRSVIADNVGGSVRCTFGTAMYGAPGTQESYYYVFRVPLATPTTWTLIVLNQTGTVTKIDTGKYKINIGGTAFNVAFHGSTFYAGIAAFEDAATSGDPIDVTGVMCNRGKSGTASYERWFVVEKLP